MICNYCNGKGQVAGFTHPTEGWQQPSFCHTCKGTGQLTHSRQRASQRQASKIKDITCEPASQEIDSMILQAVPCTMQSLIEREDIPEALIIQAVCRLKFKAKIRQKGSYLEAVVHA